MLAFRISENIGFSLWENTAFLVVTNFNSKLKLNWLFIILRENVVCVILCVCVCVCVCVCERERDRERDRDRDRDRQRQKQRHRQGQKDNIMVLNIYIYTHITAFHLQVYYFGLDYSK